MTKQTEVHLGYEVGTGSPVSIPIRNMVVCGQTQEAGKTTTLEALIARAGAGNEDVYAVAFATKRGEGAFRPGSTPLRIHTLEPFLRERGDWRFVQSLLEAVMGERMKFERSWIIQASKGAATLAHVQANVKRLLTKAKGLSESVYVTLDAYLDIVVPRIRAIDWADGLELHAGMNLLDISDRERFPSELQGLVIRSVLEELYESAGNTITILPEAWEFLPQSRGSPVKLAATELIRKGSALRNYIWLDSQDIGGVDKTILRSCPVWLLGVQREANEIKRTLDNIPAGIKKPKPGDIATLEKGQFFACFGKTVVKTYVQPAWMRGEDAIYVARHPDSHTAATLTAPPPRRPDPPKKEPPVAKDSNRLDRIEGLLEKFVSQGMAAQKAAVDQYGSNPLLTTRQQRARDEKAAPEIDKAAKTLSTPEVEMLYEYVRSRLAEEAPKLLKVLLTQNEIEVEVKREVIHVDGNTLQGSLALLILEGFFDKPTKAYSAFQELSRIGKGSAKPNVYKACDQLAKLGFLRKEDDGFHVRPGTKKNIRRLEA